MFLCQHVLDVRDVASVTPVVLGRALDGFLRSNVSARRLSFRRNPTARRCPISRARSCLLAPVRQLTLSLPLRKR